MYGGFRQIGRTGCLAMPAAINQALCALVLDQSRVNPVFVQAVLNGWKHKWKRLAGSSRKDPNITRSDVCSFHIPVPNILVQNAIAAMLVKYASSQGSLTALITCLRRRKAGLMQDLFTGRRRFSEFQVEDWFEGQLGNVMKAISRPVEWDDNKIYRLASVRRWGGGVFEREHLRGKDIKVKSLFHLEANDILLSHIQAAYGAIARVPKAFAGAYVSSTYSVLVSHKRAIDPIFAGYLFNTRWMWHQAYLASNGFFAERLRLCFNEADFLRRPVSMPASVKEQRKIAKVLTMADREIRLLEKLRDAIGRQKRGLMQRLLTGEMLLPESLIKKLVAETTTETALQRGGEPS